MQSSRYGVRRREQQTWSDTENLIMSNYTPFGDNTPLGWSITAAYFVATAFTFVAARAENLRPLPRTSRRWPIGFWGPMSLGLLVLGLNKQLDLQRGVPRIARLAASILGWSGSPRPMKFLLLALVASIGIIALVGMAAHLGRLRNLTLGHTIALLGGLLLMAFVLGRAATFHHVNQTVAEIFGDVSFAAILELTAITSIALGAILFRRKNCGSNGNDARTSS